MKLRKLLPIVFLSIAGLAACGPKDTYDINLTNSSDITAEWHVGDADRVLQLEAKKNGEAVNAAQLLNTEIFVTSSNTDVLTPVGLVLKAVSAGEVEFTVRYNTVEISYELEILPVRTCIDKYHTVHAGTEADPLDYADAINIGKQMKAASKSGTDEDDIYIKGTVKYWYHFPGERKGNDEATSWFIEGAEGVTSANDLFEMYKITKEDGKSLSDTDIWPGAEVLIKGQIGYYNNQMETTKGTFVRVTGGAQRVAPELKQTGVNTRNTGALAIGNALEDGDTTWDRYEITGYTVNFLGTSGKDENKVYNYMIADSKTETDAKKQFEIYGTKTELKFNEKVKVTCRIKNYHKTIETNMLESVEVLEAGTEWVKHEEPTVIKDKALADLFADDKGNYKQAYEVTGIVSKWDSKNGTPNEDGTDYGNFYLKTAGDDEHEYYIYGATATESALAWNEYANKYSFVNPKDFKTNSVTKGITIGTEVTMKLVRCDYTKTVDGVEQTTLEATGLVVSTNLDDRTFAELEKFTFHSDLTGYKAYNAEDMEAFLKAASDKGAETNYVSHTNNKPADNGTDPLIGANGGSNDTAWKNYDMLKLGSTSKNASIKLTFKDGVKIGKVVIKAAGWVGKKCALTVNDSKAVSIASPADAATFKAALEAGTAYTEYTISFTESNEVVFTSTLCVLISEITFYSVVEAAA